MIGAKPLRIQFDKIGEFVRVHDESIDSYLASSSKSGAQAWNQYWQTFKNEIKEKRSLISQNLY